MLLAKVDSPHSQRLTRAAISRILKSPIPQPCAVFIWAWLPLRVLAPRRTVPSLAQRTSVSETRYLPLSFRPRRLTFDSSLAQAFATGRLNNKTATFSIQVFSSDADTPIYEYHYGHGSFNLNSDTLYRIGSISKVTSVYTILAKLGDGHWDDPVAKYLPELACANSSSSVDNVDWHEVTLGSLASHLSGIGRDCT